MNELIVVRNTFEKEKTEREMAHDQIYSQGCRSHANIKRGAHRLPSHIHPTFPRLHNMLRKKKKAQPHPFTPLVLTSAHLGDAGELQRGSGQHWPAMLAWPAAALQRGLVSHVTKEENNPHFWPFLRLWEALWLHGNAENWSTFKESNKKWLRGGEACLWRKDKKVLNLYSSAKWWLRGWHANNLQIFERCKHKKEGKRLARKQGV